MVEVYAICRTPRIPPDLLTLLKDGWVMAFDQLRERGVGEIAGLNELEISLLDDREMARIHREFFQKSNSTDVITFAHGEILIGVETAMRQADEFQTTVEREIALYGIHGMLHLAGFDDREPVDFRKMTQRQEELCAQIFAPLLGKSSFFRQSDSPD